MVNPLLWAAMFWGLVAIGFWWMLRKENPLALTAVELAQGGYRILLEIWSLLKGMGKSVG